MEQIFKNGKLFIFDLDGTLYEGTDHFDYYAGRLLIDVADEHKRAFMNDYKAIKNGVHCVQIGKAYDLDRDLVLTLDPLTLVVVGAQTWDGEALPEQKRKQIYQGLLSFDFEHVIAIGDGWWLPFVVAMHYQVEDSYPRYLETKQYMVTDAFQLTPIPGVREGLLQLKKEKKMVLVTNSDSDDVGRLLKELDLEAVFEHMITAAKKPSLTNEIFTKLMEQYQVKSEEVVSIGDNFINEIAPALQSNMSAIYIDPQGSQYSHERLVVVSSLGECFK